MRTFKEKLSILSEMIAFAKANGVVKSLEYDFLLGIAVQLGVDHKSFDLLFEKESEHLIPKTEAERILQFHRLVLLMNVDEVQDEIEINRLHNIGLSMGLPPSAISQVLEIMHLYPNKVVPPKVLIKIFKAHHN